MFKNRSESLIALDVGGTNNCQRVTSYMNETDGIGEKMFEQVFRKRCVALRALLFKQSFSSLSEDDDAHLKSCTYQNDYKTCYSFNNARTFLFFFSAIMVYALLDCSVNVTAA